MGLTQKILLFTSLIVVALVGATLTYTNFQADRLAHDTIQQALAETKGVWETFQGDRFSKLKLGIRVLGNDSPFKAAIQTRDVPTVYDLLQERGQDLGADFFIATDSSGVVIARSDRPGAEGLDLSKDPVVMKPLEGEESATVWRQGDRLFHAVSVPMQFAGNLVGVLIAGYGINEALANDIRKLTHSEVAYLTQSTGQTPQLSVSSLAGKESALKAAVTQGGLAGATGTAEGFEINLGGDRYVGTQIPLRAASGEVVGSMLALRSLTGEMAAFSRFRSSLVLASLLVMVVALALAYVAATRVAGPVRRLVSVVERARDGSYTGAVAVATNDEIGLLARAFNRLLADLREKEQMIGFLRDGLTQLRKGAEASTVSAQAATAFGATTALPAAGSGPRIDKGTLFAGRFDILDAVGKGGMGVVYRAQDRKLDEIVALKVLRADVIKEDPNLLDRFKQEIKLARRITHRNVLRTHDFDEADGVPYISMEYLDGVTLKDLIRQRGALPFGVGLRIAKQMCQGLEAAHRQGVVHRDIKPQNMLIVPETGELKIMDFGIARVSEMKGKGMTSTGTVMGTPDYMPPEQAQGRPADFRSDIYSLGVVLFEVFTGSLPFAGETVMSVVLNHIQKPPPPPREINPRIPANLEAIIIRCLEKDPDARYRGVMELLDDLSAVSATLDVGAA